VEWLSATIKAAEERARQAEQCAADQAAEAVVNKDPNTTEDASSSNAAPASASALASLPAATPSASASAITPASASTAHVPHEAAEEPPPPPPFASAFGMARGPGAMRKHHARDQQMFDMTPAERAMAGVPTPAGDDDEDIPTIYGGVSSQHADIVRASAPPAMPAPKPTAVPAPAPPKPTPAPSPPPFTTKPMPPPTFIPNKWDGIDSDSD